MHQLSEFTTRAELDSNLAEQVANSLAQAIADKGRASIAVSGGSTPKGFFKVLASKALDWSKVTVTLADERWVDISDNASNTRLVHEHLLQGTASEAKFFHLKQGEQLSDEILADLNLAAEQTLLPFDVLILGMGEDGHTASLFPCSEQIEQGLNTEAALLAVQPSTAPHQRISFSFSALAKSHEIILHICGTSKKAVLEQALAEKDVTEMPIRAFLHHQNLTTQVFWAE